MQARAIRLGLTGGIGSGKSTVAILLKNAGAALIDADAISRDVTGPGGPAIAPIKACFGPQILDTSGALDRNAVRQIIFSDSSAKVRLEAIVHPIVRQEIGRKTALAEHNQAPCIVFDIPLLVESGQWREMFHRIVVVDCTQTTQISRVVERNGLSPDEILKIIAGQASRERRLNVADVIVFNEGITIDELEHRVREIAPQFGL